MIRNATFIVFISLIFHTNISYAFDLSPSVPSRTLPPLQMFHPDFVNIFPDPSFSHTPEYTPRRIMPGTSPLHTTTSMANCPLYELPAFSASPCEPSINAERSVPSDTTKLRKLLDMLVQIQNRTEQLSSDLTSISSILTRVTATQQSLRLAQQECHEQINRLLEEHTYRDDALQFCAEESARIEQFRQTLSSKRTRRTPEVQSRSNSASSADYEDASTASEGEFQDATQSANDIADEASTSEATPVREDAESTDRETTIQTWTSIQREISGDTPEIALRKLFQHVASLKNTHRADHVANLNRSYLEIVRMQIILFKQDKCLKRIVIDSFKRIDSGLFKTVTLGLYRTCQKELGLSEKSLKRPRRS